MAQYVISDIHGYLDRMFDVLRIANFDWDNDELYILGDIIDRGPQSAEALYWAVEDAPKNVHFLLGNHEDMAYGGLFAISDYTSVNDVLYEDLWSYNGGYKTLNDCQQFYGSRWCHKAAAWIKRLPLYYIVDNKLLIHAGLCEEKFIISGDCAEDSRRREYINIFGIETPQWSQHLLWIRESWLLNQNNYPYDIIFGHTPTTLNWMEDIRFLYDLDLDNRKKILCQGDPGDIVRMSGFDNDKVRYCIDTGRERMGLLRLDDYMEFYSDLE